MNHLDRSNGASPRNDYLFEEAIASPPANVRPDFTSFDGLRIALLGGSFDPPTHGHLMLARRALEQLDIDAVVFLPAAQNPLKGRSLEATDEERTMMLSLLCEEDSRFHVVTSELRRPPPSYAVVTLEAFSSEAPHSPRPFFIIGEDVVETLPHWRDIEKLINLTRFVAHTREGATPCADSPYVEGWLRGDSSNTSSTKVRHALRKGEHCGEDVPPAIIKFIETHRLYFSPSHSDCIPSPRESARDSASSDR